eukprot:1193189-Prorocentrum_minimum.AAC.2
MPPSHNEQAQQTFYGQKITVFVKRVVLILTLMQALALFVRAVPTIKNVLDSDEIDVQDCETIPEARGKRKKACGRKSYDPFQQATRFIQCLAKMSHISDDEEEGEHVPGSKRVRVLDDMEGSKHQKSISCSPSKTGQETPARRSVRNLISTSDHDQPIQVGKIIGGNFAKEGLIPIRIQSLDKLESRGIINVYLFEKIKGTSADNNPSWFRETTEEYSIFLSQCTYPVTMEYKNKGIASICRIISIKDADLVCMKCNKGNDEDKLVLCDRCGEGMHIFCMVPSLNNVPNDDFICPKCQ